MVFRSLETLTTPMFRLELAGHLDWLLSNWNWLSEIKNIRKPSETSSKPVGLISIKTWPSPMGILTWVSQIYGSARESHPDTGSV